MTCISTINDCVEQLYVTHISNHEPNFYQRFSIFIGCTATHFWISIVCQRWSRGHKAQGQGQAQGHKNNPRPMTALPRTDPLEAKDRNAPGQGPRIQVQVFSKKNFVSGDLKKKGSSKKFLLMLEWRSRGFYVQAYADDLAVLVTGVDML